MEGFKRSRDSCSEKYSKYSAYFIALFGNHYDKFFPCEYIYIDGVLVLFWQSWLNSVHVTYVSPPSSCYLKIDTNDTPMKGQVSQYCQ